ncbi:hypothetical protein N9C37_04690 [Planktomarina temperata]|nr:hypothetical protein [Planktomarina temperata]
MIKFLKRTFYVILGLIALGSAWLYVYSNSGKFATDIAYLECSLRDVGSDAKDKRFLDNVRTAYSDNAVGRLANDWIKGKVLLNWIADEGETEDGLSSTIKLSTSTSSYAGYSYSTDIRRTFNRNTLLYTWQKKEGYNGKVIFWMTRQCVIIDKRIFEAKRKKSADATKANQKI